MDIPVASVQELARACVEGEPPRWPPLPEAAGCVQLAWALKDICHACWSSEPQRTPRVADVLRRLADAIDEPSARMEIDALAHWAAGIAHLTRAAMREAIAALDLAATRFTALGRPHAAAMTRVPRVMALSMLGQHTEAIACADAARQAFLAQGDMHAAGKVGLNLGSLHLRRDAYAEAARHYREASVYFARVGDREHSVMADIGLADACTSTGDFNEALRIYERAGMRARTHGFPVLRALVEESMALLHLVRGRYREALAGLESARERYAALGMPQQLAVAEKQLADAYLDLRLLGEARHLYDTAFTRLRELDLPDEMAWVQLQSGRTLALLQQPEPASEALAAAAALFAAQGNAVGGASVALARAELALAEGANGRARAWAEQAAAGFLAAARPDAHLRAETIGAEARLAAGDAPGAEALFAATLERAHALQVVPVQVRCQTGLGLCARARHDNAAAQRAFGAAVECFEDLRSALPDSDLRSAFLADHLRPYQELLRLALDKAADDLSGTAATGVLRQLERFRARALADSVAAPSATEPGDDASTTALRERLNWLYRRLRAQHEEGRPSATLTDELRSSERQLLERARRRRLAAPRQLPSSRSGFEPSALQSLLRPGDALLEYGLLDDELFACIVTHEAVLLRRRLARWAEVHPTLASVRFQIEALRHGVDPVAHRLEALTLKAQARLQKLHGQIWAPLADALQGCRRVLVAPCPGLGALPFAALHDGVTALADRHSLAMVPSATLAIAGLRRTPSAARRVLALGESTRLPHAAQEARRVAGLFPHGTAIVGPEATLEALHAHAGSAQVLHLACHAQFRADNPVFSALHLVDGVLTAEAASRLGCEGATIVLSACESALADPGGGDLVGLVRGFMAGGAARVVGSLWPVSDESTAGFMSHFYESLRQGQPATAALQAAQLRMRACAPHPYFWAAFVVHGGW